MCSVPISCCICVARACRMLRLFLRQSVRQRWTTQIHVYTRTLASARGLNIQKSFRLSVSEAWCACGSDVWMDGNVSGVVNVSTDIILAIIRGWEAMKKSGIWNSVLNTPKDTRDAMKSCFHITINSILMKQLFCGSYNDFYVQITIIHRFSQNSSSWSKKHTLRSLSHPWTSGIGVIMLAALWI